MFHFHVPGITVFRLQTVWTDSKTPDLSIYPRLLCQFKVVSYTILISNGIPTEYMADLNVVSKYNCYSFCFLPHTLTRQSPRGSLAVDGACAVATRGETAYDLFENRFWAVTTWQ